MKLRRKTNRRTVAQAVRSLPSVQSFAPDAVTQYGIVIPSYARGRQLAADLRAETVKPTNKPPEA